MNDSGNGNGNCLHLVLSSGRGALARCRAVHQQGDALLFLADGVLHLGVGDAVGPGVHYARADLEARGLLSAAELRDVFLVDDDELIDMLLAHSHCLSWK